MEVILLQDIKTLGKENELVKVKPGYARNYLLPQKLAVVADESGKKQLAEREKQDTRREEKMLKQINTVVEVLKSTVFKIGAKTGTSGKIFGAVTNHSVAAAIKKQKNISVDRRKITLNEEVKNLGNYTAKVDLHKDVSVDVSFEVVAE
jgi:large subunit ribosomal protein L9